MARPGLAGKEASGQTAKHVSAPKPSQSIPKSLSQQDWQHMKDIEGASNDAIDAIMNMIGLEEVKAQVLRIKSKIDVTKRQNTSLKDERFNIVLLGNPGTGSVDVFSFDSA
jgi:site-specific recombinase XerC